MKAAPDRVWTKVRRGLWKYKMLSSGFGSYLFRYSYQGRMREMGLGSILRASDAEAIAMMDGYKAVLRDGHDPIEVRKRVAALREAQLPFDRPVEQKRIAESNPALFAREMAVRALKIDAMPLAGVYCLYDEHKGEKRLYYIGSSRNVYERIWDHRRIGGKNSHCSEVAIYLVRYDVAIDIEERMIAALSPPGNDRMSRRARERNRQLRDERVANMKRQRMADLERETMERLRLEGRIT